MNTFKSILRLSVLPIVIFLWYGCPLIPIIDPDGDEEFLVLHYNAERKIGDGSYMSVMKIKNESAEFDKIADVYPRMTSDHSESRSMLYYVDASGDQIVLALHGDFNSLDPAPAGNHTKSYRGALMNIKNKSWKKLPLLNANRPENEYTTIECTPTINENGLISYVSGWNDRSNGDTWYHHAVRYNPKNDELLATKKAEEFAKQQPEASNKTANAWVDADPVLLSDDGKFIYGSIWGGYYSGWNFIKEFSFLYKYDIQKTTFERIGETEDNNVKIYGWTRNKKQLLYLSGTAKKLLNLENNNIQILNITLADNHRSIRSKWNDSGYIKEDSYYKSITYFDLLSNELNVLKIPNSFKSAHFTKDGDGIYFTLLTNSGNYLCRMNGLTDGSPIDTLSVLPTDVADVMYIY